MAKNQGLAMTEAAMLRKAKGLGLKESHQLRKEIIAKGGTVAGFLSGEPVVSVHGVDPMSIMKAAGELIKVSGNKERATEALEMFSRLTAS